jgi:hypothetical protein
VIARSLHQSAGGADCFEAWCQWVNVGFEYTCWVTGDMALHDAAMKRCQNMLCSHTHCMAGCLELLQCPKLAICDTAGYRSIHLPLSFAIQTCSCFTPTQPSHCCAGHGRQATHGTECTHQQRSHMQCSTCLCSCCARRIGPPSYAVSAAGCSLRCRQNASRRPRQQTEGCRTACHVERVSQQMVAHRNLQYEPEDAAAPDFEAPGLWLRSGRHRSLLLDIPTLQSKCRPQPHVARAFATACRQSRHEKLRST